MGNPAIENIVLSVVWNTNEQLLLIFKNSRWTLPGGHIEPSEQSHESIQREMAEETRLKELKDYRFLFHYEDPSPDRHRIYFIYESSFRLDPGQKVPFKKNEGIEKMGWFKPDDLPENISPIARQTVADLFDQGRQKEEFLLRNAQRLQEIKLDAEKTLDRPTTKLVAEKLLEIVSLLKKPTEESA